MRTKGILSLLYLTNIVLSSFSQPTARWGSLKKGSYAVGFNYFSTFPSILPCNSHQSVFYIYQSPLDEFQL